MKVGVLLENGAIRPTKAHESDAGFDFYSPKSVYVPALGAYTFDTGVHMVIPDGYVGMVKSKSGLNVKYGLQCEGVIDAGYTGTIKIKLFNHSKSGYIVNLGDKIGQMVILPLPAVELIDLQDLPDTERGDNGFGSTGR